MNNSISYFMRNFIKIFRTNLKERARFENLPHQNPSPCTYKQRRCMVIKSALRSFGDTCVK